MLGRWDSSLMSTLVELKSVEHAAPTVAPTVAPRLTHTCTHTRIHTNYSPVALYTQAQPRIEQSEVTELLGDIRLSHFSDTRAELRHTIFEPSIRSQEWGQHGPTPSNGVSVSNVAISLGEMTSDIHVAPKCTS